VLRAVVVETAVCWHLPSFTVNDSSKLYLRRDRKSTSAFATRREERGQTGKKVVGRNKVGWIVEVQCGTADRELATFFFHNTASLAHARHVVPRRVPWFLYLSFAAW